MPPGHAAKERVTKWNTLIIVSLIEFHKLINLT